MADKLPKYEVIDEGAHPEIFELLEELVEKHHDELVSAKIGLAWINDVKEDRDGRLLWGRAKKVGALERQFHEHDFIVQLNKRVWHALDAKGRTALLDHELSHCGAEEDEKTGDVKWVLHKHEVEEFVGIVRRYGLWKQDVEAFVNAALKREQRGMFDKPDDAAEESVKQFADAVPGGVKVTLSMGGASAVIDKTAETTS